MYKDEWLKWRHEAITASDAACLYEKNPYKTCEELYSEKISDCDIEDNKTNPAMRKGIALEPILRERFSQRYSDGVDPFKAALCELKGFPFIRASLDGLSEDRKTLIEIKYMGAEAMESDEPPFHYWVQVQHQLLCSGAQKAFLVKGNEPDGSDMKILEIEKDAGFLKSHLDLCCDFWRAVETKTPTEWMEKTFISQNNDENAVELAIQYERLLKEKKEIEKKILFCKGTLLTYVDPEKKKTAINNLEITRVITSGAVDYSKIEELKGVDLEKYKKESRESFRITVKK